MVQVRLRVVFLLAAGITACGDDRGSSIDAGCEPTTLSNLANTPDPLRVNQTVNFAGTADYDPVAGCPDGLVLEITQVDGSVLTLNPSVQFCGGDFLFGVNLTPTMLGPHTFQLGATYVDARYCASNKLSGSFTVTN